MIASNEPGPPSPAPRRRGLAGLLAAFMETHNIFWGELVGGMLLVGCSIALVVTLWERLGENPVFKFLTFIGADAAVFGAGLYTLRRWKLESTSRGLLVIAMLLAPVTFLGMTFPLTVGLPLDLAIQILSLIVLFFLIHQGARVLVPDGPWLVSAVLVASSAGLLLVARVVTAEADAGRFLLGGLVPVVSFGVGLGIYYVRVSRRPVLTAADARALFLFLGFATFALLVPLGLLIYEKQDLAGALGLTSMLLCVTGLPIMEGGLLIHRGLAGGTPGPTPDERKGAAAYRAAGTAVGLAGMMAMLISVGLAWPWPAPVLIVCSVNFVALTVVAFRSRLPAATHRA